MFYIIQLILYLCFLGCCKQKKITRDLSPKSMLTFIEHTSGKLLKRIIFFSSLQTWYCDEVEPILKCSASGCGCPCPPLAGMIQDHFSGSPTDLLNPLGGPLSRPQSSLIRERSAAETALLILVPTPLVVGDNKPPRLKSTPSSNLVQHLEGL
ncbi:UNVERIFIED_CONTAM: hypothetical protein NCL1_09711 [Trichonephila clavipes]